MSVKMTSTMIFLSNADFRAVKAIRDTITSTQGLREIDKHTGDDRTGFGEAFRKTIRFSPNPECGKNQQNGSMFS